jgi:outer membrane protein, multidrug efflux system
MRSRALLLLAVTLAACATTIEPDKPTLDLPERFSATGAGELPAHWWTSLGDPDLDRLVDRALAGNLSLRTAWDRLDQALAVARRAGAAEKPTLTGEASLSRSVSRSKIEGPTGSTYERSYRTSLGLGLVAAYEVDLWGGIRSARDATVLDARASEEDLRAAALTLSARVAETWVRIVIQTGQLALLEQQVATNEKVLEVVTLRFRSGRVGAEDVLRQRLLVESRRGEIIRATETAEVLEHELAVLLGLVPTAGRFTRRADLAPLPPLPSTGLPAEVVARRPDVRAAWLRVRAADRRSAAAVADRYPALRLTGRIETTGVDIDDLFRNWLASLAGGLTAPLLDGGRRAAEADRTRAVTAERLHAYGQTVLDAIEEVETALVEERRQRESIASLERQLELSEDVLGRIHDAYRRGGHDYLRVLDALASSQALQRTLLSARGQLVLDRIALCRALAGAPEITRPERAPDASAGEGNRHG